MSQEVRQDSRYITSNKVILFTSLFFMTVCLSPFIYIFNRFPPEVAPEKLSAVGQVLGSLFSLWALIGLIASQVMQSSSLQIQQRSLQAQGLALADQISATKASNSALAMEILANSLRQIETSCNRIARSLILSLTDQDKQLVLSEVYKNEQVNNNGTEFCYYLNNNENILELVLADLEVGLSRSLANAYIDILNNAEKSSSMLSKELKVIGSI